MGGGEAPPPMLIYWVLIEMRLTPSRGLSDFGSEMVKTPFLNDASALSSCTLSSGI